MNESRLPEPAVLRVKGCTAADVSREATAAPGLKEFLANLQVSLAATQQVCAAGALVAVMKKLGVACNREEGMTETAGNCRGDQGGQSQPAAVSVTSFGEVSKPPPTIS